MSARWIGVPLLVAFVACSATHTGSFRFTGNGMEEAFKSWRAKAPPEIRATIDALDQDETVLIHIIRGKVVDGDSRGASSTWSWTATAKQQCLLHPEAPGVSRVRNWDVIYDQQKQRDKAKELGFSSPIEALLQHEIMGHIVPVLRDVTVLDRSGDDNENDAIEQENVYRRGVGLPLVPWRMRNGKRR